MNNLLNYCKTKNQRFKRAELKLKYIVIARLNLEKNGGSLPEN